MKNLLILFLILSCLASSCSSAGNKPLIGVSSGFSDGKVSVKQNYCSAVLASGGTPVILPLVQSAEEADTVPTHKAALVEGTLLHSLLGTDSICVNSFHHQAVCRLAPCFRIAAQSEDGVIEAYESTEPGRLILCVQFHPEAFVAAGDSVFIPLFRHFISATRL